jgi:hypothetical protein
MEYTLTTMAHDTVSDASGDVVRIDLPQTLGAQASEIADELTAELIRPPGVPDDAAPPEWPRPSARVEMEWGRERPSGSICDSLVANGGGKYLPTYVRRVLAVS